MLFYVEIDVKLEVWNVFNLKNFIAELQQFHKLKKMKMNLHNKGI